MKIHRRFGQPTVQQVRLVTGLIVGVFVTLHLCNHALGIISLDAQEAARPSFMAFWGTPFGQVLLYGSLIIHVSLGLRAIVRRRQYRIPLWEGVQIILGLLIPYLLLLHIISTRGMRLLGGSNINYPHEVANLWMDPIARFRQTLLVLVIWTHFAFGLHFWLRNYSRYRTMFPVVLLGYVLLPLASLLGFAEAGMSVSRHAAADPQWYEAMRKTWIPANPRTTQIGLELDAWAQPAWIGLVALLLCGARVRNWIERRKLFTVTYGNGAVRAPVGMSILEVSRMARRPHLSVCGGRARCTTCRVRILQTAGDLPAPNDLEAPALARIGAPDGVRLACQTRPQFDLAVQPLLDPNGTGGAAQSRGEFGQERELTVLFLDVRGSTGLAEAKMPFDVVFVFNHLLAEMAKAVDAAGGYYSNFTGDGLMAMFGLQTVPDMGARAALQCAADMLRRLDEVNDRLTDHLDSPLRIGIGIHTGVAIVGRMGAPANPVLTAIGDSVNISARLQDLSKDAPFPLVVSAATLARVAENLPELAWQQAIIRGREAPLRAASLDRQTVKNLLAVPI